MKQQKRVKSLENKINDPKLKSKKNAKRRQKIELEYLYQSKEEQTKR